MLDKETTPIYVRLDKALLRKVEELAKFEDIDKNDWIRRAILDSIDEFDEEMDDFIIDEYIQRRISKNELLNHFKDWKEKIPSDIEKDREEYAKKRFTNYIKRIHKKEEKNK